MCGATEPGGHRDRRYSTADARSRARKSADGRIPAETPGQHGTHTGAQWTGRHTHGLHNSVSAVKDLLGLDISQACNASATKTIAAHPASAAQTFCVADFTVGMMSAEDSAR